VPYPFAHPAAVLPLVRLGVPSALAIGSVAPDLWYLVPLVERADAHALGGLLWFCLPAGLALYLLFHLVLKEPLIALISPRLSAFACSGLPARSWGAVLLSLLLGILTHLVWDAFTHANSARPGVNWLQHANTAAGSAVLGWWLWRKLRALPARPPRLSPSARIGAFAAFAAVGVLWALGAAEISPALDLAAVRHLLRNAGISALQGFCLALVVYCFAFRCKMPL
jgi:hypothetical protein